MRLNKDNRQQIVRKMLRHRFTKDYTALAAEKAILAEKFYKDAFKEYAKMNALPNGWLPEHSYISVRISGAHENLYFNGDIAHYERSFRELEKIPEVSKRVPAKTQYSVAGVYDGDHPLAAEFQDIQNRFFTLYEEYDKARTRLSSILNSIYNTEKLVELWPETEPFLDGMETIRKTLPAIPLEQMNKMFELPVS